MKHFLLLVSILMVIVTFPDKPSPLLFSLLTNTLTGTDTITKIEQLRNKAVYKTPTGRLLHVYFVPDKGEHQIKKISVKSKSGAMMEKAATNALCDNGNAFDGSYRKEAKLSVVSGSGTVLNPVSLSSLLSTLKAIKPSSLHVSANSPRVAAENKLVQLPFAFLYAIKRESDEDYHIIIGTTNKQATAEFFNVECAGLPPMNNKNFQKLKAARDQVVTFLNGEICKDGYTFFDDFPKIKVSGSLFYDKEHENSIVGPAKHKPKTAWELHPITEFVVL
ncbi:MAG: hypothetical protein ICV51_15310 [Flavisolibacter sp.]|nr:hypothetical protein [Flavisolibacter sp.]